MNGRNAFRKHCLGRLLAPRLSIRTMSQQRSVAQSTAMISSFRLDGTTATMTISGATDTEVFRTYVEQVLCATLRRGDIVVMEKLGAHKRPATLALIEAAGAEARFLPRLFTGPSTRSRKCGANARPCCAKQKAERPNNLTRPSAAPSTKSPEMMPAVGLLRAAIVLLNIL